jgi:hypothetical protein
MRGQPHAGYPCPARIVRLGPSTGVVHDPGKPSHSFSGPTIASIARGGLSVVHSIILCSGFSQGSHGCGNAGSRCEITPTDRYDAERQRVPRCSRPQVPNRSSNTMSPDVALVSINRLARLECALFGYRTEDSEFGSPTTYASLCFSIADKQRSMLPRLRPFLPRKRFRFDRPDRCC